MQNSGALFALRAGMMASRLYHRERVIPALTDHLEDKGGVIGSIHIAKNYDTRRKIFPQTNQKTNQSRLNASAPSPPRPRASRWRQCAPGLNYQFH